MIQNRWLDFVFDTYDYRFEVYLEVMANMTCDRFWIIGREHDYNWIPLEEQEQDDRPFLEWDGNFVSIFDE